MKAGRVTPAEQVFDELEAEINALPDNIRRMKVVFSDTAKAGLRSIALYIARDNKKRAVSFVQELRAAAIALGDYPEAYPLISRYEQYGHRRKPYGDYLIIYTVEDAQVMIDTVLHGAQDYVAILFPNS